MSAMVSSPKHKNTVNISMHFLLVFFPMLMLKNYNYISYIILAYFIYNFYVLYIVFTFCTFKILNIFVLKYINLNITCL